jgi:N-acetylated-alpha-linked acidic dipeptidase
VRASRNLFFLPGILERCRRVASQSLILALVCLLARPMPVGAQDEGAAATLVGFSPSAAAAEQQWEQKLQALPDSDQMRRDMQRLSLKPHALGQPYDQENAEWILEQFRADGLSARIEKFQVLLATPKDNELELLSPDPYKADLSEGPVPGDPTSSEPGQLPPYNAFSIDGDVTAPLVYVNYGLPEDYALLARMGISVKGKIVLARYGRSWRGVKPKVAAENGAIGCIIYSDPRDDGFFEGDVFPKGPMRPPQGVQRGSVLDISLGEGDPSTPDLADGNLNPTRLPLAKIPTLTKIPTLPIGYGNAQHLLSALDGPVVPLPWRGALGITYHVGPSPAQVHLKVTSNWNVVNLYDVIAQIPGSEFPDQWVIRANHHDAWVFGADDPLSGTVSVLAEAKAFGTLLRQGWRPRRTVIFAAWDGEEPMTLGSTEWAEVHAKELDQKAVAYINTDNSDTGFLRVQSSHTLEHFFNGVAKSVKDPKGDGTIWQAMKSHQGHPDPDSPEPASDRAQAAADANRADVRVGALGSGSDYTAFIDHLGIASADLRFAGGGRGGVYHSAYDDYYWYTHFGDPTFTYERALAETLGTSVMRLADAQVLPFEFTDFADTIHLYVSQLQKLHDAAKDAPPFDLGPLDAATESLQQAAGAYGAAYSGAAASGQIFEESRDRLGELNRLLYTTERKMLIPNGLPRRAWYRDAIYAPGTYTGYGVKTLPGLREAMEGHNWQEAGNQEQVLVGVLNAVTAQIQEATTQLATGATGTGGAR